MRDGRDNIVREGWLRKQNTMKVWQLRWFVLTKESIRYFHGPQDARASGTMAISNVEVLTEEGLRYTGRQQNYSQIFYLKHPARTYALSATAIEEATSWMDALNALVEQSLVEGDDFGRSGNVGNVDDYDEQNEQTGPLKSSRSQSAAAPKSKGIDWQEAPSGNMYDSPVVTSSQAQKSLPNPNNSQNNSGGGDFLDLLKLDDPVPQANNNFGGSLSSFPLQSTQPTQPVANRADTILSLFSDSRSGPSYPAATPFASQPLGFTQQSQQSYNRPFVPQSQPQVQPQAFPFVAQQQQQQQQQGFNPFAAQAQPNPFAAQAQPNPQFRPQAQPITPTIGMQPLQPEISGSKARVRPPIQTQTQTTKKNEIDIDPFAMFKPK